MMNPIADI